MSEHCAGRCPTDANLCHTVGMMLARLFSIFPSASRGLNDAPTLDKFSSQDRVTSGPCYTVTGTPNG